VTTLLNLAFSMCPHKPWKRKDLKEKFYFSVGYISIAVLF
jgi:hypothetical protein